jgi:hypothetical protein
MTKPNVPAAGVLRGADGQLIYLVLLSYADRLARIHGWTSGKVLPAAASPQSVVHDIVVKVLQGTRTWDPEREPDLLIAMKGMVRSDIGHLFDRVETNRTEPIKKTKADGTERSEEDIAGIEKTPEDLYLDAERTNLAFTAMDLILKEIADHEELQLVFLALNETGKPSEISKLTGIPIERVYTLKRDLDRIAERITPQRVARVARQKRQL